MIRARRATLAWLLAFGVFVVVTAGLIVGPLGPASVEATAAPMTGRTAMTSGESAARSFTASNPPPATDETVTEVAPTSPPPAVVPSLRPGSVNATSIDLTATYVATVRVNFGTRSFRVDSTMTVTNTSGIAIDRLELNTVAARLGSMTITVATVDGLAVMPAATDQTIHVPLGGILDPGATATVRIAYRSTLRSSTTGSNWLFTRVNGVLDAYRWLPWISRPIAFTRPNHGDPFETPVSPRVRITIVSDRVMHWATTGQQVGGGGLTKVFEARNVRDFSVVGAPDYVTHAATVGGVLVRVWSLPGFPWSAALAAGTRALSKEAALLGAYPYPTYDLAQTAGGFGMESPGLTWIPTGAGNLPYLIAHETGHQWFYGIVGNDQARQPFADEAATDFVARYILRQRRASLCSTARLDLTIYQYSSACYYEDIYIQGGNFLDDLRRRMGSTAFWAGVRDYLRTNRFKLAGTKTLLDTLDAHTPLDLVPRFHPRFPSLY